MSLKIKQDTRTRCNSLISLEILEKEIFEITVEAPALRTALLEDVYHSLQIDLKLIGDYKFQCNAGMSEVVFKYDGGVKHTVMTNLESNIHQTNVWLCGIWPSCCQCLEYYVSINDTYVEESKTFADCGIKGIINVDVVEKCFISPCTEDNVATMVPWNKNIDVMGRTLSKILKIDYHTFRLTCRKLGVLDRQLLLNIEDFRSEGSKEAPRLSFEVLGAKIRCTSMINDESSTEVMIVGKMTVLNVKRRLAFKMKEDERRYVVSRESLLLNNDDLVSNEDNLSYCIGHTPDSITDKKLVGKGSYGNVFECYDARNRKIALKELIYRKEDVKEGFKDYRIQDLLFLLTVVSHPNIVRCLDIYIDGDNIAISMEFIAGGSLRDYLRVNGKEGLAEDEIREFTRDIVKGLQHLHSKKIIHRDIRGANVVLGDNKVAKLCDFGLSKILTDVSTKKLSEGIDITAETGTFRWMAPEVIKGQKMGMKMDVWSVGATMVEMITGENPFPGMSDNEVIFFLDQHSRIPYQPKCRLSDTMQEFVDSCLTAAATDRPNVHKLLSHPFLRD